MASHMAAAAHGGGGYNNPPPSTLAAQLVENIAVSSVHSSRSDETQELQKFFTVIERFKNDPNLLKTTAERVEHNHMLIYVYCRVALDGLTWEDPFADRARLKAEALKTANFIRVTIRETPAVLAFVPDEGAFLFRRSEPLWLWVLPKILKLLGSERCIEISSVIESLCEFILGIVNQAGPLWGETDPMICYFQTSVNSLLSYLSTRSPHVHSAISLELPSKSAPSDTHSGNGLPPFRACTYRVTSVKHAARHACGLLNLLSTAVSSSRTSPALSAALRQTVPWLVDSLQEFHAIQAKWGQEVTLESDTASTVHCLLKLATLYENVDNVQAGVHHKILNVLVLICGRCLDSTAELLLPDENGVAIRKAFCLAMVQIAHSAMRYKPVSRLAASQLLNPLGNLTTHHEILGAGTDFSRCMELLTNALSCTGVDSFRPDITLEQFVDTDLRQTVSRLKLHSPAPLASQPVTKRRKLSSEPAMLRSIIALICKIFQADALEDYEHIQNLVVLGYSALEGNDACRVLDMIAHVACAADNTLALVSEPMSESNGLICSFCSGLGRPQRTPQPLDRAAKLMAVTTFTRILKLPAFHNLRKPRVVAMMAMRRLVAHFQEPDLLDLEKSAPGHWCLQSLNSSIRELRIAAGRTLVAFLRNRELATPQIRDVVNGNKSIALGVLKTLSDKDVAHLNETCIMTWGQMGIVVSDKELNLVIVQLLNFLGHRNTIVSAFAFNEVLNLASARNMTPRRLFEPFWKSIAFTTVKDMIARPQTTRVTAEILQLSVTEHLLLVQQSALPWLVLTRKKEVIQKIAEARGETEVWKPCLDNANLSYILALLLVQEAPNIQEFVLSTLQHISSHFNNITFQALIGSETVLTVLELLRDAGEASEERRERIRLALHAMASTLIDGKQTKVKKKTLVARFLQSHALGLTSNLAEVINDGSSRYYPVHEQKRSIRAMEEMIKMCTSLIRIARPQISAFLLSALCYDELRASAFSCWAALLMNVDDEDVNILIEMTFFIIGNYWDTLDDPTKDVCKSMLDRLLTKKHGLLEAKINELPSFSHLPGLADAESRLNELRKPLESRTSFMIFSKRLGNENPGVVLQALAELSAYLREHQAFLQTSAIGEQPDMAATTLLRALLDCASKYNGVQPEIGSLCVQCLGSIGCLDSNRLEVVREQREFVVLHNFEMASETTDFVLFILEEVLVKAFLSTTDTSFQGYLSYAMQELLDKTDFKAAWAENGAERSHALEKYLKLPEHVREVLAPFMTSRYRVKPIAQQTIEYPIFRPSKPYANWLRAIVTDLLHNGQNPFAEILFEPLRRVIKVKDLTVAEFLLPYLVIHIVVSDDNVKADRERVLNELRDILLLELPENASYAERENMRLYCEAVFRVLDYSTRWLQMRKVQITSQRDARQREPAAPSPEIKRVEQLIKAIPADLIARRAMDCGQYARALFNLEPHATKMRNNPEADKEETNRLLSELQYIYTQIDEPDGLEGISARLGVVDLNQQILSHRKAGRWSQAQAWYELRLAEEPNNVEVQLDLLTCLKESGQYDVLLNYVEGIIKTPATINRIAPFAVEASWATGRWDTVQKYLSSYVGDVTEVFNLGIGQALMCLRDGRRDQFAEYVHLLRDKVSASMSHSATSSLQACHDAMLKAHVLTDLEVIAERSTQPADPVQGPDHQETSTTLSRRLEVIGAYVNDKQYLLGIRRAAMELMRPQFGDGDISSLWLTGARLARKAGSMHQSFNAVLHAHRLGDDSATIDNARLLWKEGNHRKAIQVLQSAISSNNFIGHSLGTSVPTSSKSQETQKQLVTAQAHLLLAKWQDSAGQTHASALRQQYQLAAKTHLHWEKGHYYLGRHYKKVLESEQALKPMDQSDEFLSGDTARLVIENYIRSLNYGTKYLFQTLPRILTLWLELGSQVDKPTLEGKISPSKELQQRRKMTLEALHKYLERHMQKMPAYIFYTVLPQMVARIAHPNAGVFRLLHAMIVKVVEAHPRQALWSLFGIMTTKTSSDRKERGLDIIRSLQKAKKVDGTGYDLRQLMRSGEKLANQLLLACQNGDFQSNRTTMASLKKDLNFNPKCTPCPLVVPIEACLTPTLPALTDNVRRHAAFSQDLVSIQGFKDEVLVLSSLAKPRKLLAQGSDGRIYGLMVKPKDDLRTDQRLMEFNGMINRSLKRDAESSRRQLYIRTYAVTPLNEECGIIEWVDGLKTLRDILLTIYRAMGITPNYNMIGQMMKDATAMEGRNVRIFSQDILGMFPAVLPLWFMSQFPNPSAWFAARLKYTRSCAVMSMVGTILGLGDRHGENVLLQQGDGGVFHVDFNCLFDKGLTFATPERVPFRLTHNMQAAMGMCGHEGAFRKCSELTLSILRQQEETLMTILEAFVHDPTLDLQKEKKNRANMGGGGVRLNPRSVVESIRRKVRGLLPEESIPLGVEGQVEELIKRAIDHKNLTAMYIGWCPFL
ncbi:hypothetical protein RB594_005107 [Gaeumannomyces avenae]